MRKQVTVGFLSIVCLLFVSGMLSFVELSRLSRDTGDILKASRRNIELAKEILDAAHELNVSLIHSSVFGDRTQDNVARGAMARLESVWLTAQEEALDKSFLDSLAFAATEMKILVDSYLTTPPSHSIAVDTLVVTPTPDVSLLMVADTTAVATQVNEQSVQNWYTDQFETVYSRLTTAVKAYMTSTQSSLAPRTEQMKKNAYRAVTPVLISLVVMIAIVLMFYYFMMIYCVNPMLRMNKSLGDYLSFKIPFSVKSELKDEVLELKEKIDTLIGQVRKSKLG